MNNLNLEQLSDIELQSISGGSQPHPWLEIAAGVICVGVAIAAEFGTAGLATVPASSLASAGAAAILHGSSML